MAEKKARNKTQTRPKASRTKVTTTRRTRTQSGMPGGGAATSSEIPRREIARRDETGRDEWVSFLDGFSKQHEGWLVNVETAPPNQTSQRVAHDLPLEGIAISLKHGGDDTVSIILAKGSDEFLTHNVSKARHIWLLTNQEGAHEGLDIVAADRTRTTLRFRSPMLPETVDGVVG